jgi:hypothetical protein
MKELGSLCARFDGLSRDAGVTGHTIVLEIQSTTADHKAD